MKRKTKRHSICFSLLMLLVLLWAFLIPVKSDDADIPLFSDEIGYLTGEEASAIKTRLAEIEINRGFRAMVSIESGMNATDTEKRVEALVNNGQYSVPGVLMVVNDLDKSFKLTALGYGIRSFDANDLLYIQNKIVPFFETGEYYQAFVAFADACEERMGVSLKNQETSNEANIKADIMSWVYYAVLVVLLVLLLFMFMLFFSIGAKPKSKESIGRKERNEKNTEKNKNEKL